MLDNQKVNENINSVNENMEYDLKMQKLRQELSKSFSEYRRTISFMAGDAPLEILCLPTAIENCLLSYGCLRIYDLFNCDFTKVKGLGASRIRDLTSRLDQFFSML